jgi:Na+/H+-dicarboxylate symporter
VQLTWNTNDHALVLMLTKRIAGVPRASLVVVAATCGMFDIPKGIAYCRLIIL